MEDRHVVHGMLGGEDVCLYGVFDGHGGKFVARKCAEYDWGNEQSFEEIFWKLDETLGPQSLNSGTTASIMMIECVLFSLPVY